jgi:hypothetical protein
MPVSEKPAQFPDVGCRGSKLILVSAKHASKRESPAQGFQRTSIKARDEVLPVL